MFQFYQNFIIQVGTFDRLIDLTPRQLMLLTFWEFRSETHKLSSLKNSLELITGNISM